jgi:RNA polymerase sigma factor (sigma-70 family)
MITGAELIQDHDIMLSVREGDIQKLGLLFEKYSKELFNFFQLQIKDRLKSEDLLQNVFYSILRYRHTYKDGASFKAWMFTIARNEKNNYFKRNKAIPIDMDPEHSIEDHINPENDLERKTELKHLETALENISPDNRELIILSRFNGLQYKQISEIVGCSIGAIKVRMYRAMQELKDQFSKIAGEHENEV